MDVVIVDALPFDKYIYSCIFILYDIHNICMCIYIYK